MSMDGRGRPVKREERQGNPVRDEQGNLVYEDAPASSAGPQNDEGVREINGSRRPSTTMGTDGALHMPSMEQMARLDGDREQDELRRTVEPSSRPRRGSANRLHLSEDIIESSTRQTPSSGASSTTSKGDVGSTVQNTAAMNQFLYNLHQQQMAASGMAGGPLKTFPSGRATSAAGGGNAGLVPSAALEPQVNLGERPSMGFVDSETASMAPAEPERPVGSRGRRPSIGQLF